MSRPTPGDAELVAFVITLQRASSACIERLASEARALQRRHRARGRVPVPGEDRASARVILSNAMTLLADLQSLEAVRALVDRRLGPRARRR